MSTEYQKELNERDANIIRFNNVGLGLSTISQILGCHPSTITHRLKKLGITPVDTRRAFMEDIIAELTEEEQEWLVHYLEEEETTIKGFVTQLIKQFHKQEGN